jgi:hypothetical protein
VKLSQKQLAFVAFAHAIKSEAERLARLVWNENSGYDVGEAALEATSYGLMMHGALSVRLLTADECMDCARGEMLYYLLLLDEAHALTFRAMEVAALDALRRDLSYEHVCRSVVPVAKSANPRPPVSFVKQSVQAAVLQYRFPTKPKAKSR